MKYTVDKPDRKKRRLMDHFIDKMCERMFREMQKVTSETNKGQDATAVNIMINSMAGVNINFFRGLQAAYGTDKREFANALIEAMELNLQEIEGKSYVPKS